MALSWQGYHGVHNNEAGMCHTEPGTNKQQTNTSRDITAWHYHGKYIMAYITMRLECVTLSQGQTNNKQTPPVT